MMCTCCQLDIFEQPVGAIACIVCAGDLHWDEDVFRGGQRRYQMKRLEDKANLRAAKLSQFVFAHRGDVLTVNSDFAGGGRIESRNQAQERGFTATRGADHRNELSVWY